MKKFLQSEPNVFFAEALLRIGLGVFFLVVGIGKLKMGAAEFVEGTASGFQDSFLPMGLVKTFLWTLPYLEPLLGVFLILGIFRRWVLLITGILLIIFIFGLSILGNPDGMLFVYLLVTAFALTLPSCAECCGMGEDKKEMGKKK